MTAVHQFVPTLAPRDAVGRHYLAIQETLRAAGYRSDIYSYEAKDEYKRLARPFTSFAGGRGEPTWLLYHSSVGSPVADFVAARDEPLIVDYHNITPAAVLRALGTGPGRRAHEGTAPTRRRSKRAPNSASPTLRSTPGS